MLNTIILAHVNPAPFDFEFVVLAFSFFASEKEPAIFHC
jgi:hypothetical protein